MTTSKTIACYVGVSLAIGKDSQVNQWVAVCKDLNLATQERTKGKVEEAFREALKLWLESCIERNTLVQALDELGFVEGPPSEGETRTPTSFVRIITTEDEIVTPVLEHERDNFWQGVIPITTLPPSPLTSNIYHAAV